MLKRIATNCLSQLLLLGVCSGENLKDELRRVAASEGIAVAMFARGNFSMAPTDYPKTDWTDVAIPGAIGHAWSYEGMLSPDGTLAAYPYWEANPCPSWTDCDTSARRHFYLAIVRTDGSSLRKYPEIVLPSQMCWTRDNSRLAMVAQLAPDAESQMIILDLNSGDHEVISEGKKIAITPQCWSPDGRELVYFSGEKDSTPPGAIRVLNVATKDSRDLLRDDTTCKQEKDRWFCAGLYPTWSPDGDWIAYFQHRHYWAVHPSGEGRKNLFRRGSALSPLQWSPDMRYALYADCCAFLDTWRCMCEIGRIHVRRLSDNADVEISGDGYQNMFIPRWVWVRRKPAKPPSPSRSK